jgi:hypothetical protein
MVSKLVMMATQEGNSPAGGLVEKPPVERDLNMLEAAEASRVAGQLSGEPRRVFFLAVSERWERNQNRERLTNESAEPVRALGDWRSRLEPRVRQHTWEVTQQQQTIDRITKMLEAHAARKEVQLRGMKAWPVDRETKWDDRRGDNVLRGAGIMDMTAKILATDRVGQAAPTQEGGKDERNQTGRQDGRGLGA